MPNQDGSLTDADRVTLVRVFDRLIPTTDAELAAGALGILDTVEKRSAGEKATRSAFLRVVEALSLDLTAHAIGGFSAMTNPQQIQALRNIERTLPEEFSRFLGTVRDVYYENDRTPTRPENFDSDDEVFGRAFDTTEDDANPKPFSST